MFSKSSVSIFNSLPHRPDFKNFVGKGENVYYQHVFYPFKDGNYQICLYTSQLSFVHIANSIQSKNSSFRKIINFLPHNPDF